MFNFISLHFKDGFHDKKNKQKKGGGLNALLKTIPDRPSPLWRGWRAQFSNFPMKKKHACMMWKNYANKTRYYYFNHSIPDIVNFHLFEHGRIFHDLRFFGEGIILNCLQSCISNFSSCECVWVRACTRVYVCTCIYACTYVRTCVCMYIFCCTLFIQSS